MGKGSLSLSPAAAVRHGVLSYCSGHAARERRPRPREQGYLGELWAFWGWCARADGKQNATASLATECDHARASDHSTAKVDPIVGVEYVHVL